MGTHGSPWVPMWAEVESGSKAVFESDVVYWVLTLSCKTKVIESGGDVVRKIIESDTRKTIEPHTQGWVISPVGASAGMIMTVSDARSSTMLMVTLNMRDMATKVGWSPHAPSSKRCMYQRHT